MGSNGGNGSQELGGNQSLFQLSSWLCFGLGSFFSGSETGLGFSADSAGSVILTVEGIETLAGLGFGALPHEHTPSLLIDWEQVFPP